MSVSQADVDSIIQLINNGNVEALQSEDFDIFQYQGFDPKKIVVALLKVKTAKSMSNDDFMKDVFTMVAIAMIKGSVNERNINKMSDDGKARVTALNSKYGIHMGGGRGQPSNIITYPRVMATFPDVAVRLTSVIGGKEFRGGPMGSTRLPEYMQVQVFPAVIPTYLESTIKKALLLASLCYSIDQTVQISEIKDPEVKQLASSQNNFTIIGHNSPIPTNSVRTIVFKKVVAVDDYPKIKAVLEDYKRLIDETYKIPTKAEFSSAIDSLK